MKKKKILNLMKKAEMTYSQVAKSAKLSSRTVWRMVNDEGYYPNTRSLEKLEKALGLKKGELL